MSDTGADGSPETTKRLLEESRELLGAITDRLAEQDGAFALDPEVEDEPDSGH